MNDTDVVNSSKTPTAAYESSGENGLAFTVLTPPNAVLAESLLGLARAWDRIETTGDGLGNVANIANQIIRTIHELGVDEAGDIWDELILELRRDPT